MNKEEKSIIKESELDTESDNSRLRRSNYNRLLRLAQRDNDIEKLYKSIMKDAIEDPEYANRESAREMIMKYFFPSIEAEIKETTETDNKEIKLQLNILNSVVGKGDILEGSSES
jgi:hypothetical protein